MKKSILLILFLLLVLTIGVTKADFTFGTPTPIPNLNILGSEVWASSISSDDLSLYFTSGRSGGSGYWDIWVTTRESASDSWGPPMNLGPTVNSSSIEMDPTISSDGLSLYFSDGVWDIQSPRQGGFGGADIWVTSRTSLDSDWGPPVNLGSIVNSSATEGGPSISSDGLSLFFECGRSGGSGSYDIWMTSRPALDGDWGPPVNLGPVVNSSSLDVHPDISADGLTLYFQSDRSGSQDLWITTRSTLSDPFGPPVHIGPMINTSGWRAFPNVSSDSRRLFFTIPSWYVWQVPIHPVVDLNFDGIVDAADMCIIVDHWGDNYSLCDVGPTPFGDGIVDVQDLIVLAEHLFEEIFPPELITYWKLDETEGDIAYNSTNGTHGILRGNPAWRPDSGKVAGALEFDGIDDYIETGFVLNPTDGPFSVFAWIKGGAPGQVVISQLDGDGTGQIWLGADPSDGKLMTGLAPLAGRTPTLPLMSEFIIIEGEWHHVGIVIPSYGVRNLYVDGMRVASDAQGVGLPSSNGGLYFGASKTLDAGTFFSGLIDDVRIYNVALTPEEIAALAQ